MPIITAYPSSVVSGTWENPDAIFAADGLYARTNATDRSPFIVSGFDFSRIPDGSTINSMSVETSISSSQNARISSVWIASSIDDGVWGGFTTALQNVSIVDLGYTKALTNPTLSHLKSSAFQVNVEGRISNPASFCRVDYVRIVVDYTPIFTRKTNPITQEIIPPLSQAVVDMGSGTPTKALADFMHQVSTRVKSLAKAIEDTATEPDFTDINDALAEIRKSVEDIIAEAHARGAAITETQYIYQTELLSIAEKIEFLTAAVKSAAAAIRHEQMVRAEENYAEAMRRTVLIAQVDSLENGLAISQASIIEEQTARADADSAEATERIALAAVVNDPATGLSKTRADLSAEQTARASADSAEATARLSLATTVGSHTTSISTISSSVDGIRAQYSVEIDANGRVTGFKLIGTGTRTDFDIRADKFAVTMPGATEATFTVEDGKVKINGQLLTNTSVNTTQITNNAVTWIANAYTDASVAINRSWTTLQTVTITSVGGSLIVSGSVRIDQTANDGSSGYEFVATRLRRDSTVLMEFVGYACFLPVMYADNPAAGTYVYTIEAYHTDAHSSYGATKRYLSVQNSKK